MVEVAEAVPALQPQLFDEFVRQRLGGHHHRMDRDQQPSASRQCRAIALGRQDDGLGADPTAAGMHRSGFVSGHRALLVDADARLLEPVREAARQSGRMDGCAVRHEHRADGAADIRYSGQCVSLQPAVILLAESQPAKVVQLVAQPPELCRVDRDFQRARLVEVAVDRLFSRNSADIVNGVEHQALQANGALALRRVVQPALDAGKVGRTPASVAPGSAEAGDLRLQDDDIQRGVQLPQVPGRPQAGVARADDGHVTARFAIQRRPRLQIAGQAVMPEAQVPVGTHGWG